MDFIITVQHFIFAVLEKKYCNFVKRCGEEIQKEINEVDSISVENGC